MQPGDLIVSVTVAEPEVFVTVAGEIDMYTVGRLATAIEEQLPDHPDRIVVDLSGVTLCDSMGLGTLVLLNRSAQRARSRLILRRPSANLRRLLEITGVGNALDVEDAPAGA